MDLRSFIIQYRAEHGLSQRQFAEACGVSNGYISMIERGENPKTKLPVTPTLTTLKKIATGIGITLSAFLTELDDMDVCLDDGAEDDEIINIMRQLSPGKKDEALRYLRYLASCGPEERLIR